MNTNEFTIDCILRGLIKQKVFDVYVLLLFLKKIKILVLMN